MCDITAPSVLCSKHLTIPPTHVGICIGKVMKSKQSTVVLIITLKKFIVCALLYVQDQEQEKDSVNMVCK